MTRRIPEHIGRMSCRQFRHNGVRLQLHALACILATFLRYIELPAALFVGFCVGRCVGSLGGSSREPASSWPGSDIFQRGGQTC